MPACAYPDTSLGVVLRLSTYLDCQARALGEQGFQALIGDPMITGLLSALVTVFVALIGYRLILGHAPSLAGGVGWAVRLGFVLALVTGWPAFQTLVYRVGVDGPAEIAAVLLPATSLPAEGLDARVQQAYDTIRLGAEGQRQGQEQVVAEPAPPQTGAGGDGSNARTGFGPYAQPALPQTAAIFAVSTVGVTAALRVAIGLLLALAPLAILGLLFDATLGLFAGWLRALGGAALGLVGANLVTALDLMLVEGELGNWQAIERGVTVVDQQGLTTLVLCFVPVMLGAVWAAARMAGAIRLGANSRYPAEDRFLDADRTTHRMPLVGAPVPATGTAGTLPTSQARAQAVADALAGAVSRERAVIASHAVRGAAQVEGNSADRRSTAAGQSGNVPSSTSTANGRRTALRRSGSAARRDRA